MSDTVLRAHAISKSFRSGLKDIPVLSDVSLELCAGEALSIRGSSGSGKTTLLNILSRLETPDTGEVWWGGKQVEKTPSSRLAALRGKHLGMVFQSYYLIPELNALDNVLIAARLVDKKWSRKRGRELLERVGLSDRMDASVTTLSGGERQRVAVARALMNQPPVLLADEPTGNLDERTGNSVMDLLLNVCAEEGAALVLVTHNDAFAHRTSQQLVLHEGRLAPA